MFIVDTLNARVRRVYATGDVVLIATAAGSGAPGGGGDGGPATLADLNLPSACAFDVLGRMLIADTGNARVRAVSAGGYISTVAGLGAPGFGGDGGPATLALLNAPCGVWGAPMGGFYVADTGNNRVRYVSDTPSVGATITTVAGSGDAAFSGDGGPATLAALDRPTAVACSSGGAVIISDTGNDRVRSIDSCESCASVCMGAAITARHAFARLRVAPRPPSTQRAPSQRSRATAPPALAATADPRSKPASTSLAAWG